jgi:periplasmic protein TonB
MSDNAARTTVPDRDAPPDWRAVAPKLDVRSLAAVALAVPLLLAVGVYWLHRVPSGTGLQIKDNVVEVRLIGPQAATPQRQDPPQPEQKEPQPEQKAPQPSAEAPIADSHPTIPEGAAASASPESTPAAPAHRASLPATSAATARVPLDRKAQTFQRELRSHIARYERYPEAARPDRAQGTVQLVLSMQRDGTVTGVRIASGSGYNLLDTAAVETIRRAQPLPRIPAELPERLDILLPLVFDLPQ